MKPTLFSNRWLAPGFAIVLLLFLVSCSRTVPMQADDDGSRYVDYASVAKRLIGMDPTQVQRLVGSPDDIQRLDSGDGRVVWKYERRFSEADARCVYKHVSLTFENRKLISIQIH